LSLPLPLERNPPELVLLLEVTLPEVPELLEKKLCSARKPARMAMINLMSARPTILSISSTRNEFVKYTKLKINCPI
jgi:hypothetical protein